MRMSSLTRIEGEEHACALAPLVKSFTKPNTLEVGG